MNDIVQNQKQLDEMRKEHKEEVQNMTKAIENTIALTVLLKESIRSKYGYYC